MGENAQGPFERIGEPGQGLVPDGELLRGQASDGHCLFVSTSVHDSRALFRWHTNFDMVSFHREGRLPWVGER